MTNVKTYQYLAEIYNHLMDDVDYNEWAEYLYDLMAEYIEEDPNILELACGSCTLTNKLKKYFDHIIATDFSKEMLIANPADVSRICCDMKNLPFKVKFDIVFSAFDSINYLLTEAELIEMLKEVHLILEDEGIFTFDVSLEANSINNAKLLNRSGSFNSIEYVQKSEFDRETKIHYNKFELVTKEGKIIKEVHKQKIYSLDEYFSAFTKTGFFVMEALDSFSFDDVTSLSERAQFVLKKERD